MRVRTWDYMVCYKRSLFTAGKPHTEHGREGVYCLENWVDSRKEIVVKNHPLEAT